MADLLETLEKLNPWWSGRNFDAGIVRRQYLEKIEAYLKSKEILALTGVRRAGKTTLLLQTIDFLIKKGAKPKQILFVNLDDAGFSGISNPIKQAMDVFFQEVGDDKKKAFLVFDEIQAAGNWEKWAKTIYDEKKHQLIVSGSSSGLLDSKLARLLSGRYFKINVFPLFFEEYLNFNNTPVKNNLDIAANKNKIIKLMKKYLFEGGFPRIALEKNEALKKEFLATYYETIMYKDIILAHEIRQPKLMKELVYYLATNIGCLQSYKKISEQFSADFSTIKEYFYYLEDSKTIFEVPIFSYSLKTQSRNNKKIYCIDNGLRNAVSFQFSKDTGKLAENLVFIELKRRNKEVYYWKNKGKVDFIVKNKNQSLEAINVSYTNKIEEREKKSLLEFKKQFKNKTKKLVLITKNTEKTEKNIKLIPLWKWLLE